MVREVPATIDRLKALRCLVAVAEHGSALRAAGTVHLSQSAVTRAILDLERHVGQPLFDRHRRGLVCTPLGRVIAARAERVHEQLRLGADEALELVRPRPPRTPGPERFATAVSAAALKVLLAVAAQASACRAAQSLRIGQPAVHRSLQSLEDACGVAVYARSKHGTRLTDAGHALLRRVKLAVAELRALEADVAALRGELRGRIIVGVLPLSGHLALPQAVATAVQHHPALRVTVVDGTYASLVQQLMSADVDIVFGALRRTTPTGVVQEALFADDLVVVARPGHPCFFGDTPTLGQLRQWRWVVPLPGTPARAALERFFAEQQLEPPTDQLLATSAQFTRALVADTDYLALESRGQACEDEQAGLLRIVPIALGGGTRQIGIVLRSGELPPDVHVLVEELRRQALHRAGLVAA